MQTGTIMVLGVTVILGLDSNLAHLLIIALTKQVTKGIMKGLKS